MRILGRDAAVFAERRAIGHWMSDRLGRRPGAGMHKPEYLPPERKTTGNGPFAGVLKKGGEAFPSFCAVRGKAFRGRRFLLGTVREAKRGF